MTEGRMEQASAWLSILKCSPQRKSYDGMVFFFIKHASIAAGGAFKTSLWTTKKTPFPIIPIGKLWRYESSGKYVFLPNRPIQPTKIVPYPTSQFLNFNSVSPHTPCDHRSSNWDWGGSSLGLRLQRQNPFTLTALLLMGWPISLLALWATVACHLASSADVELPQLQRYKDRDTSRIVTTQINEIIPINMLKWKLFRKRTHNIS